MATKPTSTDTEDQGGAVEARKDCPHVHVTGSVQLPKSVDVFPDLSASTQCHVRMWQFYNQIQVQQCEHTESWLCCSCHKILCGRYGNKHMMEHHQNNATHCIAMSCTYLSFWCYECKAYLDHISIAPVFEFFKIAHLKKFQQEVPQMSHQKFLPPSVVETKMDVDRDTEEKSSKLLSSNDLKGVAQFIQSGKCRNVSILAGAGISVSAGIPDFRSSDGFYQTYSTKDFPMLTEEQATRLKQDPEEIFTIDLFEENPSVYLHARKEFILSGSKYAPTLTHWFFKLLEQKKLLKRFYSTNIDGLDVATNLDQTKLVHVHGTCGSAACYRCGAQFDMDVLKQLLESNKHLTEFIRCDQCQKDMNWIKPNTVLFGEDLPDRFGQLVEEENDLNDVDLLIIAGTSLSVSPSNNIPDYVHKKRCVRVLVNREMPDMFPFLRENDVFVEANCDDAFRELARLLKWDKELQALITDFDVKRKGNHNEADQQHEQKQDK